MNASVFSQSFKEVEILLKSLEILQQKGVKNINKDGVSIEFKKASQEDSYKKIHSTALEKFDYDFLLEDQSFFQFQYENAINKKTLPNIRYAYFQNPQGFKTYLDFLHEQNLSNDEIEEIGDSWRNEYEQFLTEMELNVSATTIRFDVESDFSRYKPLIHSNAHLHIGHKTDIRIPFDKIITPLQFVFFVLKHTDYNKWKENIEKNSLFVSMLIKEKKKATVLSSTFFANGEKDDIYLI